MANTTESPCNQAVNRTPKACGFWFPPPALVAPPTGFFQIPGALDAVRIPVLAWVGSEDSITPPAQTEWLAHTMRDWQAVDVRVTHGAGHFSFMDQPPPQTTEPLADKHAFLREHSSEVCKFVVG
ncbi:alpha/beta hydrolase [Marinobacter sp. TBZ242]|uniref:Alpha/beta hydrolase n=1 Tax=Marinobacter azerbaijanicus TaxID=3050455 RepID=A0ABT7IFA9_9GAMM|nr:alpha/beta hydrolase [Marinobacter sp. TBZ242]MDL0432857.1 alpha/beta hydrolase [Marinobacter sp. TBZ242]